MKPTVISAANANSSASASADPNAVNIPINHEHHAPHYANAEATANAGSYGSPRQQAQRQIPAHFQQGFGFEPDMDIDMDMFPRGRLGRMHHDPFAGFGASHFGFPQFGSMGRRRMPNSGSDPMDEDGDFFNRLPNEFRQYIPEGFGHRRAGSGSMPQHPQQQQMPPQQQHYQPYQTGSTPPNSYANMPPQSPSKKLCDAAIQTEDPASGPATSSSAQDQVDHAANLSQHGLRNTVDLGVKTNPECEQSGPRAHSAPPPEQMQQNNGGGQARRITPPQQTQFGTQTSPQAPNAANAYQKAYYPPQQQAHPQQKQHTPPPNAPQTPGGTYIRTIPIFVEGRSEPIINAHKEIPNQNQPPPPQQQHQPQAKTHPQPQQQQPHHAAGAQHHQQHQRPAPLNTQQQATPQQQAADGPPPQTPHTLDSINKIQDIQRDVLDLMGKVEKFAGTRKDKEYAYLDEMLTRNLLKLDTIDTQGKDSIRLARKEAIKCIQASINVLEAKAEENAKTAQAGEGNAEAAEPSNTDEANAAGAEKTGNEQKTDEFKAQEPIPLPPPAADKKSAESNQADAAKETSPSAEITANQETKG